MLCIGYVSKAKVNPRNTSPPDFIPEMLSLARKKNKQLDITSAFIIRQGRYLQLLEGKSSHVDNLYKTISQDNRHEQVEKIIDIPISNRSFEGNEMLLMLNIQESTKLVNFLAEHKNILLSSSDNIVQKLQYFGCENLKTLNSITHEHNENFYANKRFLLKEAAELDWFEIDMLNPEFAVAGILLAHKLFGNKYSYKELLKSKEFGSAKRLVDLLNRLNSTGKLLIDEASQNQRRRQRKRVSDNQVQPFSQKLLSWLRIH